ncbi:hypothetical protein FRC10_002992 [Ceratobasidium sp. 414]|nr:hypothetical protein FRC10_002992 [Ceratobasidium sp. 414]
MLDTNGSPGSPPAPNSARRATSPSRAPAEEFSTVDGGGDDRAEGSASVYARRRPCARDVKPQHHAQPEADDTLVVGGVTGFASAGGGSGTEAFTDVAKRGMSFCSGRGDLACER